MAKNSDPEKELHEVLKDRTHGSSYLARKLVSIMKELVQTWEHENLIVEGLEKTLSLIRQYHPNLLLLQNIVKELLASYEQATTLTATELARLLDNILNRESMTTDLLAKFLAEREEKVLVTISHSGTIIEGLQKAFFSLKAKPTIIILESIPGNEGLITASQLKATGFPVIVIADTSINTIRFSRSIALIGFDQIDNQFILNKSGTKSLAFAFKHQKRPVIVAGSTNKVVEKIEPDEYMADPYQLHSQESENLPCYWPTDESFPRFAPVFEAVEISLIDMIITDCGMFSNTNWENCYDKVIKRRKTVKNA